MLCLGQSLIPLILVSLFHLAASGCCHLQRRLYSLAGLSPPPSRGPVGLKAGGSRRKPIRGVLRTEGEWSARATGHNQWYLLLLLVESPLPLKPRGSSRFD